MSDSQNREYPSLKRCSTNKTQIIHELGEALHSRVMTNGGAIRVTAADYSKAQANNREEMGHSIAP